MRNITESLEQLTSRGLGPNTSIPLVKLLHPRRHGSLVPSNLALAVIQAALQPQLNLAMVLVDAGADDKETVGASKALVAR
jgi:hypothetical protein